MKTKSYRKLKSFFEWLTMITTILGIGFIGLFNPLKEQLPIINNMVAAIEVSKIRPSQAYSYVKSILAEPQYAKKIKLKTTKKDFITGYKRIWLKKPYALITYFDESDALFGYILIKRNWLFNPKICTVSVYDKIKVFNRTFEKLQKHSNGYLIAIKGNYLNDTQGSSYYLEMYHYHRSEFFYGVALTNLGKINNYNKYYDIAWETINFPKMLNLDTDKYNDILTHNKTVYQFRKFKPNTILLFDDSSNIDIFELLESDFEEQLAISISDLEKIH